MSVLINIAVPDLASGIAFYTTAFDLRMGRRFGADAVELLGWPSPVYLPRKAAGTIGASDQPRRYRRRWTPVHLDVAVDDMAAVVGGPWLPALGSNMGQALAHTAKSSCSRIRSAMGRA